MISALFSLEHRLALIVGAANTYGLAAARAFLEAGARVIVVDADAERLAEMVAPLGANCLAIPCGDASDDGIAATLERCRAFGPIDVVASVVFAESAVGVAEAARLSTAWLSAAARRGSLKVGAAMLAILACDEAAMPALLPMLQAAIRDEALGWAPGGMRVNGIAVARSTAAAPLDRVPGPDDVAGAILYFATEASAMVTGAVLVVDGGRSLMGAETRT